MIQKLPVPPTPIIENIHQKVYAAASAPGALDMGDWHTCETTHCRAGWVVALAGEAGKALEDRYSTSYAAARIYEASSPIRLDDHAFYCTNEMAMESMKLAAERERQMAEGTLTLDKYNVLWAEDQIRDNWYEYGPAYTVDVAQSPEHDIAEKSLYEDPNGLYVNVRFEKKYLKDMAKVVFDIGEPSAFTFYEE